MQISEVLPIWDGVNCSATHEQITQEAPPPATCLPDLSCCVPETGDPSVIAIAVLPTRRRPAVNNAST